LSGGGCILGRNWDKNLRTFAPCYSQSPPPADFTPPMFVFNLRFLHQQLKVGGSLDLFRLSLTFESCIVLSLINIYFYMNTSFPLRNNNYIEMHRKEENLTENHTTPMVLEIYTKNQTVKKNQVTVKENFVESQQRR
jgi:hypothetical protein